jgi:hypothetical protein
MVRANIFKCKIVAQYLSVDDAALCLSCFCRCAKICEANICGIKLQGMDGGGQRVLQWAVWATEEGATPEKCPVQDFENLK